MRIVTLGGSEKKNKAIDQNSISFNNDGHVDLFSNDENFHIYEDGWIKLASEV